MKAILNGTVLAEADASELVRIEGNWYFPRSALRLEVLAPSDTTYTCAWKGDAEYFTAVLDRGDHADAAWSYRQPPESAISRVGHDFSGYVAFDRAVELVE